jgi:hypothetical protein
MTESDWDSKGWLQYRKALMQGACSLRLSLCSQSLALRELRQVVEPPSLRSSAFIGPEFGAECV